MRYLKSRLTLMVFLVVTGLGLAGWGVRAAYAYTTSNCYGNDLYIDFYDDSGGYHGFMRMRNSPQCV
jgi:hypothetical protein